MSTYAGATARPILTDAPQGIADELAVGLRVLYTETLVVAASATGIDEVEQDDGTSNYRGTVEIPDGTATGEYEYFWLRDGDEVASEPVSITADQPSPPARFATADDVATRLGRALTDAQETTCAEVISLVEGQIIDEVDRDQEWATNLSPVPAVLKALCIGKAIDALSRPEPSIASESIGAHSVTFAREYTTGIFLTDQEKRLVRQAVYGSLSGSSTPRALHDRLIDLDEAREVDEPADAA